MRFDSFAEFVAMGGHGLYVWLSYGAAVIILIYNVASVRLARRRFLQEAREAARRSDLRIANTGDPSGAPPGDSRSGDRSCGAAASTGESNRS